MVGSNPAMARKSVVFPAPFEPTIATASPARTSTSMPSMTRSPKYPAASPSTSSITSPPEIGVDDPRVPHDDIGRAVGEKLAEVEDDRPLGELDHRAHDVLHPQDRRAELVAESPDDLDRRCELGLVQARHHLVEQEHLGPAGECLRQLEKPLLMEIETRDGLCGAAVQPHERQR